MYKLYWAPGGANMLPHAILEDIGAPFELIKVDLAKGEQRSADYLKLNPNARVPTLIYGNGHVMFESAAIALFLADRHPEAGLAPRVDDPTRGLYLQWMAYLTGTLQEALMNWWHADRYIHGMDRQAELQQSANDRVAAMLELLDRHLADGGPCLCGTAFYACDYLMAMLARWTRNLPKQAHTYPSVGALVRAALARPGYARMLAAEGIEQPV